MLKSRFVTSCQRLFCALFLLYGLVGCNAPSLELQKAKDELSKTISELPQVADVAYITSVEELFRGGSDWVSNDTGSCYYARTYRVYGTQMPLQFIIEKYQPALEQLDWVLDAEFSYETSALFERGDHERLVIETFGAPYFADKVNYVELKQKFATVFTISVDYILPSRGKC